MRKELGIGRLWRVILWLFVRRRLVERNAIEVTQSKERRMDGQRCLTWAMLSQDKLFIVQAMLVWLDG